MDNKVIETSDKLLKESISLWDHNEHYGTFLRVADIFNCWANLPESSRDKWLNFINQLELTREMVNSVKDRANKEIERIRRIISIGETFVFEEILQVLTLKVELDLLCAYFETEHNLVIVSKKTLDTVDEELENFKQKKGIRQLFDQATSRMKKNWGLPISNRWLS